VQTHLGVPGHLVTITSAGENAFINSAFNTGIFGYEMWIVGSAPADDGVWRGADEPEADTQFSFWAAPTPPCRRRSSQFRNPGSRRLKVSFPRIFSSSCKKSARTLVTPNRDQLDARLTVEQHNQIK
jgi:hypothetical protein